MGLPGLSQSVECDALRVWLDFWELSGRLRVDIVRKQEYGGDPAKMLPPVAQVTVIPAVRAVLIHSDPEPSRGRAGDSQSCTLTLELIDPVRDSDSLTVGGLEYSVDTVQRKDLGGFSLWKVTVSRR